MSRPIAHLMQSFWCPQSSCEFQLKKSSQARIHARRSSLLFPLYSQGSDADRWMCCSGMWTVTCIGFPSAVWAVAPVSGGGGGGCCATPSCMLAYNVQYFFMTQASGLGLPGRFFYCSLICFGEFLHHSPISFGLCCKSLCHHLVHSFLR